MDLPTQELIQGALALPRVERARLAQALLASLDAGEDEGVEAAWRAVIEARSREVISGSVALEDGPQVLSELRARLRRPVR